MNRAPMLLLLAVTLASIPSRAAVAGQCSLEEARSALASSVHGVSYPPETEEHERSGGYAESYRDELIDADTKIQARSYALPNSGGRAVALTLSKRARQPDGSWKIEWKTRIEPGLLEWLGDASQVDFGGLKVDSEGGIFLTGTLYGDARFADQPVRGRMARDGFLSRWSPDGRLLWIKTFGFKLNTGRQGGMVYPRGVDVDSQGNPTIVSTMESPYAGFVDFGADANGNPVTLKNRSLAGTGFLARFDAANGHALWAVQTGENVKSAFPSRGSQLGITPSHVTVAEDGTIRTVGAFAQSARFGDALLVGAKGDMPIGLSYEGAYVYSARYSADGKLLEAERLGEGMSRGLFLHSKARTAHGRTYYHLKTPLHSLPRETVFAIGGTRLNGKGEDFWLCQAADGATEIGRLP